MKFCMILGVLFLIIALAVSSTGVAAVAPGDFVGYWPLDDGSGEEARDVSGNGHHGVITGGVWGIGQIGGGLEFDGENTFIEVAHSEDFNLGASITVAAWARVDGLPHDHIGIPRKESEYVLHPTNAGGDGFNLRFYVGVDGAWASPVISDTMVGYGEWRHLAATYDGAELKVYIDGVLDKAQPQEGDIPATENPLRWSNDCCGGRMLLGALDELAILSRALDEDEIQQLMGGITEVLSVDPAGKLASLWGDTKSR